MIDTFVFDIGNVLLPFTWQEIYADLFDPETAAIVAAATVKNSAAWAELDKGAVSYDEAIATFVRCTPWLENEIRRAVDILYDRLLPFNYAAPWLKTLKEKGYKIYILSNYGKIPFEASSPRMDFLKYADGSLISYEVQKLKPDPEIYNILCSRFSLCPQHCVFIDDSINNVNSAALLGFYTVHFENYEQCTSALKKLPLTYGI